MWCGTRANATWHARSHGSATQTHTNAYVARMWHGRVAGPCESTRTPGWRLHGKRVLKPTSDGPMGLVGPSKFIGVVTQRLKSLLPFIHVFFTYFFRVGLCSL